MSSHSQFSVCAAVMSHKVPSNAAPGGHTGLGSCQPLVPTFSPLVRVLLLKDLLLRAPCWLVNIELGAHGTVTGACVELTSLPRHT